MRSKIASSTLSGVPVLFLLVASACVGREVSLGNNSSSMALVDPGQVSGTVTACAAGEAHPNVCCDAQPGQGAKCGVYPSDPFHPCDTGWKTYPDPRSCCSLEDSSKCDAPPPNPPSPPTGTCAYACPPGWYPITDGCCHDNGDGSGECYGWASAGDGGAADGGVVEVDAGPAPDAGTIPDDAGFPDATPVPVGCAPGYQDVDGSCVLPAPMPGPACDYTCPAGWQPATNAPDVCCREIAPDTFECFSQATGPLPPEGGVDGGPAPDDAGVSVGDAGVGFADAGASH